MLTLWFILSFLTSACPSSLAQRASVEPYRLWQKRLTQRYDSLQQHMQRLAEQRGWALRKNYSSKRVLTLQGVDALNQPVYYTLHNAEAARSTQTQALYGLSALPVSLSGNSAVVNGRLGLWDGGRVLASHQEFAGVATNNESRIIQKDNASVVNDHTTHLAGTLVAQGINEEAKGMAYGAQLQVWDYSNDITELATAAPGLLVSNHSYGPVAGWVYNDSRPGTNPDLKWEWWGNSAISTTDDYMFGFYSTQASDLDRIAYSNPFFLMIRSADNKRGETGPPIGTPYFLKNTSVQSTISRSRNDGYDVIPGEATAKNVLTVGAADISYSNEKKPVLVGSTAFSGWGPTDDGRIKPDIVGMGSGVFSTLATNDATYGSYTGTSMASANVAGSLFLLQELYATKRGTGLPTSGQFMRAATLKGLAIHTATRPDPASGPTYQYGWGLLNTEAAARLLLNEGMPNRILEKALTPNSSFSHTIVAQGNEPLIITLSWTDPEGTAASLSASSFNNRTPKLVNDLDLRVQSDQQLNLPFVLDPDNPYKTATQGDNIRDNVEQVYIANPVAGQTYTIVVSQKGAMTYSSQPFSLIISGLLRSNCQLTSAIQPTTDTTLCAGQSLTLRASTRAADFRYQWLLNGLAIPDAQSDTYKLTQPGSYLLQITDTKGCSGISQPIAIQFRQATIPLTSASTQWLCATRESVNLQVAETSLLNSYNVVIDWLRDGQPIDDAHKPLISVTLPGTYQARVTQNGCQALSTEVPVFQSTIHSVDLSPVETELVLPQGASVTLKAPVDISYQYQWYRNDQPLPNARTSSFLVTQAGAYKVQIEQNGCVGWSTERVIQSAVLTAVTLQPESLLTLFPNPAEHTLFFRVSEPLTRQLTVSVFDGQGILQQPALSVTAQNGLFEGQIPIQHLPAGTYLLHLTDGHRYHTKMFIKK